MHQPGYWKGVLFGGLSSLLLVPVPAFAAYTLGTWSVSQPAGNIWSALDPNTGLASTGFNLYITPQPGAAGASPVQIDFTAPVTNSGSTTANILGTNQGFDAIKNITSFPTGGTGGLTITIGFLKADGSLYGTIYSNSPNQFTGTLPSNLPAQPDLSIDNGAKKALVRFVFNPVVTWQANSSTQIHVAFTSGP